MAMGIYDPLVDTGLGILGGWLQNKWNTDAANTANANAEKLLDKQNEFNALEAQKDRVWQENMSNTAYQRARQDMEAAGINPILLGGTASAASTPVGSAANSAASHAQQKPNMVNIIQNGMDNNYKSNHAFNESVSTVFDAIGSIMG